MTRTIIAAIAIGALACSLPAWAASAKHHKHQADAHAEATPTTRATEIPGVNPMQNSPAIPPAANKQPYVAVPGVNPM
jgi:hypothetical protein